MASNNIAITISAKDDASSVLKRVGGSLDDASEHGSRFRDSLLRIRDVALGVYLPQLAGKLLDLGKNALQSAADFEQTRIGLENMLGSSDRARKLLGDLSKFAAATPFEFPELAQATRQLVAFGFSADDAYSTMKQLGDVSAAVGAPINDLAYLMGTLHTQGRAFTIDIRQFAQRGIPIYEYLARVFKTDEKSLTSLIDQGKVGFPEVQKAFEMMTAEGGTFHGTMDKQSRSLSGLWSTLSDNIGQAGREILGITQQGDIQEGSLFAMLRDGADYLIQNLPRITQDVKSFIKTVSELPTSVPEWIDRNKTALIAIASTLTVLVGPAFTAMAAKSVAASITSIAAAISTRVAWVASAVATSLKWEWAFVRMVAAGVAFVAKSVAQAVAVAAKWVAQAVVVSTAWVVHELPKIIAMGSVVAVKSSIYAADTALAWVLNAIRVSLVWTVQEMPKLVASFAVTSAAATVHAVRASAAWVVNAAKSSAAWVISELPKIVAGFFATSASAIAQATVASSAWIANASKSAVAWVITELPRIVAAFVVTAGAAIAQAAVASGAWVTAAVTSSQSFAALAALVATPIVMPAIVVAAALAALWAVQEEAQKTRAALDAVDEADKANTQSEIDATNRLYALAKNGTPDQKARAKDALKRMGYAAPRAAGGPVMEGQSYLVGEHGPELFTPATSGSINNNVDRAVTVQIMGNVSVRDESDIEQIARRVAALIDRSGQNVARGLAA